MKRPVINRKEHFVSFAYTDSGALKELPIDQTPIAADYKSVNGFYRTDIALLLDASDKGDVTRFNQLLSRLQEFSGNDNKDKSLSRLFDEWRPLYLQTPAELAAWPKYLADNAPDIYHSLYPSDMEEVSVMHENSNVD